MLAKIFKHVGAHSLAIFACLIMVIPFYLIVTNSFKTKADASSMSAALPASLHPENFATVISAGKLATSFLNSMLYASGSTIIGTLFAAMAAFVLSRNRSRFNRIPVFFYHYGNCFAGELFYIDQGHADHHPDQHQGRNDPPLCCRANTLRRFPHLWVSRYGSERT